MVVAVKGRGGERMGEGVVGVIVVKWRGVLIVRENDEGVIWSLLKIVSHYLNVTFLIVILCLDVYMQINNTTTFFRFYSYIFVCFMYRTSCLLFSLSLKPRDSNV